MADDKKVRVTINKKTGAMTTEVVGVVGSTCTQALNWVGGLGASDEKKKPEFYDDGNFQQVTN